MNMEWDVEVVEETDADFPQSCIGTDVLVLRCVKTGLVFFA